MPLGKAKSELEVIMSGSISDINPSASLAWSKILEAIEARTGVDFRQTVVPAVNTSRSTRGTLLVCLGNKIQPKQ